MNASGLQDLWLEFKRAYSKQRCAQATLLMGPLYANLISLAKKIAATFCCRAKKKPCGQCQSCQLIRLNQHPDLHYLRPEKNVGPIKIEQIRTLQERLFTNPCLGKARIIIIEPAEKMNQASSNALLKILEEPAKNTYFILISENLNGMLPTILSRCQIWTLKEQQTKTYLDTANLYLQNKEDLVRDLPLFIGKLKELKEGQISPLELSHSLSHHEFSDLIWLFQLLTAQMLYHSFNPESHLNELNQKLFELARTFDPFCLFQQLDKLNEIAKHLRQGLSLNQALLLKDLLFSYTQKRVHGEVYDNRCPTHMFFPNHQ